MIPPPRVAYLGPAGTYAHAALLAEPDAARLEAVGPSTVPATIDELVQGRVERALVPIENSLEGAVNATLDALVGLSDDPDARIWVIGERVLRISHCLIAREPLALEDVVEVVSHPQASAQCASFLARCLPGASVVAAGSTADAVRLLVDGGPRRAALGSRRAAELYGCTVLRENVQDPGENETRFVWLARTSGPLDAPEADGMGMKTSVVFWGAGATAPGWLVRCLSEFAFRGVNLTRIESRPQREGLGRYRFFLDLDGARDDAGVADALEALGRHVETLRVLGSYRAAAAREADPPGER